MQRRSPALCAALLGVALLAALATIALPAAPARATALDDYVAAPDPSYAWSQVSTIPGTGYTAIVLDLTSQTWRSPTEVDRTVWEHWLVVTIPDQVDHDRALLFIGEGFNPSSPPSEVDVDLAAAATATNSIVAHLYMVPNQPLLFSDEGETRIEDEIVAYTFDKFLDTGDDTWPLLLPMVKSAVRAMDAIQEFVPTWPGGTAPEGFVVMGRSKRGWAAWLTAAVDARVEAIAPVVYPQMNLRAQLRHHFYSYGFYSNALSDYMEFNLLERVFEPAGQDLLDIVDPYSYRDRLTHPAYLTTAAGDEYFLPDAPQFFIDELPGPTYLRCLPNRSHLFGKVVYMTEVVAFYEQILTGTPLPQVGWEIVPYETITVTTDTPVMTARLWQATDPDGRDFRIFPTGPVWTASPVPHQGGGVYVADIPPPASGHTAYYIQLKFLTSGPGSFVVTSEVAVTPEYGTGAPVVPGAGAAAGTGEASSLQLLAAPNPARGATQLRFTLERPGPVELRIHDVRGRLLREIRAGALPAGEGALAWDGRDHAGRPVASGIYLARLTAGRRSATTTFTLVR